MKLPWNQWMDKAFQEKVRKLEKSRHIHLIAIGGAAMHNLALALHFNGFKVTGSDDEIYNPSRRRLENVGLLPDKMGWDTDNITVGIEAVIVGMHARPDNPELHKAQELGLKIYSYPEFVYEQSKDKKRVVIGGSHGKTTTTAMILHVLNALEIDNDYLVGAQLEGFTRMVKLSAAPIIIIEGDEYLASPIVRSPKFHFYKPHIAILTGVAWDHINVFPTFENYVEQFDIFVNKIEENGFLAYYKNDAELEKIVSKSTQNVRFQAYDTLNHTIEDGKTIVECEGESIELKIFGEHNLQNLNAAKLVCEELGVSEVDFYKAIQTFKGASKRLQLLQETKKSIAYKDFAHAPSKVKATIKALGRQYPDRKLVACVELHTFSSLNKEFLGEYDGAMDEADTAFVYFSEHTLKMKKLPAISKEEVKAAFNHKNIEVFTDMKALLKELKAINFDQKNLLMMSSGHFDGTNLDDLAEELLLSVA
jgi:UDP-N-acetylmuramate: L-alanyl-gamma-D-glutamyl-meso-diaminopimelate ligase